jgi:hypothetical protein
MKKVMAGEVFLKFPSRALPLSSRHRKEIRTAAILRLLLIEMLYEGKSLKNQECSKEHWIKGTSYIDPVKRENRKNSSLIKTMS